MPRNQADHPIPRDPSRGTGPKDKRARSRSTKAAELKGAPLDNLYQRIVETAHEGIWVADAAGTIIFANKIIAEMLGYDGPPDLVGRPAFDFMDDYGREAAIARLKKRSQGEIEHYEFKLRRKDGSDLWVMIAASPLLDAQGQFTAVLGMFTDITHRYLEEQRLRDLLESAPDAMIIINSQQKIVLVNQQTEKLFGYNRDELLGQTVEKLVPRHYRRRHAAHQSRFIADPHARPMRGEHLLGLHKDGSEIPIEINLGPLKTPNGTLISATIRDITERERAENAIHKLSRTRAVLSNINQAIARIREPQQMLQQACQIAVEDGGFRMAWSGRLDPETQRVEVIAHAGVTDTYLEQLNISMNDKERKKGPTVRALRTRRHIVISNIEHDPRMAPWRENALRMGYRSTAAFPLIVFGQAVGTLNLYAVEPDFFDDEEVRLLDEMASDISFALEFSEQEAQRKRAERELERINRAYRTLSAVNHAVVRAPDEVSLLGDVCRAICGAGQYQMAWVGYKMHDEAKSIRPMAWVGDAGPEIAQWRPSWAVTPDQGPSGKAVATGQPQIMQNLDTSPSLAAYQETARRYSYGSGAILPLSIDGDVMGMLSVYATEPDAFHDEEVALLAELANDLSYGIQTLRVRGLHEEAEDRLRQSEEQLNVFVDSAPVAIAMFDRDMNYLAVSQRWLADFNLGRQALLGRSHYEIFPEIPDRWKEIHRQGMRGQVIQAEEDTFERLDGTIQWLRWVVKPWYVRAAEVGGIIIMSEDITQRKQTRRALEQANRSYQMLGECNQAVMRAQDEEALLQTVTQVIVDIGGFYGTWVSQIGDSQSSRGQPSRSTGIINGKAFNQLPFTPLDPETRFPGSVAVQTGRPYIVRNISADNLPPDHPAWQAAREISTLSGAFFPLLIHDVASGLLAIMSTEADAFNEEEQALLAKLAGDLAYGIQALRTRELHAQAELALQRQNMRLSMLYAVGKVVNSTLETSEILDFVVDEAMRVTRARHGQILVTNGVNNQFERRSLRGFTKEEVTRAATEPLRFDEGLNGLAYKTRQRVCVDDVRDSPQYHLLVESTRSELVVPILHGDEVVGNIDLQSPEIGAFRESDLDYLQALAEQAALAITNAQLYHELEIYSEILEQAVAERTEQLTFNRDRVEAILSSIGDALLVLRLDGRIEQVNPAFEHQTGYSAVEAEMQDHHDLLKLELGSKGDYRGALERLVPGQIWQGEAVVRRKDGSSYDAAITIAPVRHAQREIRFLVAIIRDITPLKEVERAKDQFVSNVSHELRTPITSLKLNQDLLQRNPEEHERYITRMRREINRLNVLIEDLLRLSRLDQGSAQFNLSLMDINALAAQYANDRTPLAESRQLGLVFEGWPEPLPVMADEGLLGQALSVLLTNALNYTPAGGSVTIKTQKRQAADQLWAGFSVGDTGPGIPLQELPQLFTRFFRGSVGRKSGAPGTGLGLAIAREIVERHGGNIEASSDGVPGKGAEFSVWLPMAPGSEPE